MRYEVSFAGGLRVDAHYRNHIIQTDQPLTAGGTDTAPSPLELFFGAIATCAGLYALRFCEQRSLPTEGLALTVEPVADPETHRIGTVRLALTLPDGFPEKYRDAILRAIDQCAVKRHIVDPPEFAIAIADEVTA